MKIIVGKVFIFSSLSKWAYISTWPFRCIQGDAKVLLWQGFGSNKNVKQNAICTFHDVQLMDQSAPRPRQIRSMVDLGSADVSEISTL